MVNLPIRMFRYNINPTNRREPGIRGLIKAKEEGGR
jgi:hypothetical protein